MKGGRLGQSAQVLQMLGTQGPIFTLQGSQRVGQVAQPWRAPLSHLSGSILAPDPLEEAERILLQVKEVFLLVCALIVHRGLNERAPVSLVVSL